MFVVGLGAVQRPGRCSRGPPTSHPPVHFHSATTGRNKPEEEEEEEKNNSFFLGQNSQVRTTLWTKKLRLQQPHTPASSYCLSEISQKINEYISNLT